MLIRFGLSERLVVVTSEMNRMGGGKRKLDFRMSTPAPEQKKLLDELHLQAADWLDDLLYLAKKMKNTKLENKKTVVSWAKQWIRNAEKRVDELKEFSDRLLFAENYKEINTTENMQVTNQLINVVTAMNSITHNMYKIVNHDQNERLLVLKEDAQKRYDILLLEKEKLSKDLEVRKLEIRRHEEKEKQKTREIQAAKIDEEMRLQARKKAVENHKNFLTPLEAKEALHSVEDNYIISNESNVDDCTLVEASAGQRKQRRSRSLGRKVIGSVKKTIRRSVSAIHSYIDHHESQNPQLMILKLELPPIDRRRLFGRSGSAA